MRWIEVKPANRLEGSIDIPGAKNSCLALLAASCLAVGRVVINNIPGISDVGVVISILEDLGAGVEYNNGTCVIDPSGIYQTEIRQEYSSSIRTAYYFIGALICRFGKVTLGYPGGDNFGSRPIDQHIKGLEALGARFTFSSRNYVVEARELAGADIFFDCISCGATINVMLAAVRAKGKTVIHNASRDPEVVDTAVMLTAMGARIYGAGTDTIRIIGVNRLGGCDHTAVPDRLLAGSFLIAAGVTGGNVTVNGIVPEHLYSLTDKLRETGMEFSTADHSISAWGSGQVKPVKIRTGKYPMFESDYQQPIFPLLLKAKGKSIVNDRIFPQRFNHCEQLRRMGADISVKNGVARINSYRELTGAWVHANDIRAGACLILAGLMADNTTYITGIEHIERGYEDVMESFRSLGADIRMFHDESMEARSR